MKREFCWSRLLSVLVVAVLFLAGPETSRAQDCYNFGQGVQVFLTLRGAAPDLELSLDGALGLSPKSIDSPPLTKSDGNPYKEIGTWSTGHLTDFSNAHPECWGPPPPNPGGGGGIQNLIFRPHVWLGLRNSDDQGTKFDLLAQVLLDGVEIGEAEAHCVEGLTRNPAKAEEIAIPPSSVPFKVIAAGPVLPTDSELMLKISARIGTGGDGLCKGHASATGLRLYYDAPSRPSHILWRLCGPNPCLPPIRD